LPIFFILDCQSWDWETWKTENHTDEGKKRHAHAHTHTHTHYKNINWLDCR
jgi:hypothetical protein